MPLLLPQAETGHLFRIKAETGSPRQKLLAETLGRSYSQKAVHRWCKRREEINRSCGST